MIQPPLDDTQSSPAMSSAGAQKFRRTLVRVMAVQVITLVLLWILQRTFTP